MMNNNHKKSGCGFSEQLVSYLYGETVGAENTAFEAHLNACSVCTDELEAFSGVQFSINDWKLKEFVNLAAPSIEIPYETADKTAEVSTVKGSWLSALRELFSLSPRGWSLATASFAVLAVCALIALFALNSRKDNDVAESNKTNPITAPTVEKTSSETNANSNANNQPDKVVKPSSEPKSEVAVAPDNKNNRVVKTSNNPRPTQKVDTNSPKNNEQKRTNKNNEIAPKIAVDDEEEDKSLRLAELFDEIDTKE